MTSNSESSPDAAVDAEADPTPTQAARGLDEAKIRQLQLALAEEKAAARAAYLKAQDLERALADWLGSDENSGPAAPTSFYRDLEQRLHGSREEQPGRLRVYDPQLQATAEEMPAARCIDLRCGDGVWLEQVHRWSLMPVGVDHRRSQVEACRQAGFEVSLADPSTFLACQDDRSAALITGFHLIEHLPTFEDVVTLIHQAKRVLMPGGRLILESPNPENLTVGAGSFYLDPDHRKPLHPETLSLLLKSCGWHDVRALRLVHGRAPEPAFEMPEDSSSAMAKVFRLLNNHLLSAPDFALVARKPPADSERQAGRPQGEKDHEDAGSNGEP